MKNQIGAQAVVIGAGISGLSAAQALAEFFGNVVILERDEKTEDARPRPGVPQGRQPHLLLSGGFTALSELFPGIGGDLEVAGALPYAAGEDLLTEMPGIGVLPKRHFNVYSFTTTRPVLEHVLTERIEASNTISIRYGVRALEILTVNDGAEVIGVKYARKEGGVEAIGADLVVDASGRSALTMACLDAGSRKLPRETVIGVDLGYATGLFSIPPSVELNFVGMVTLPEAPASSRSGYMLRLGGGNGRCCSSAGGRTSRRAMSTPSSTLPKRSRRRRSPTRFATRSIRVRSTASAFVKISGAISVKAGRCPSASCRSATPFAGSIPSTAKA